MGFRLNFIRSNLNPHKIKNVKDSNLVHFFSLFFNRVLFVLRDRKFFLLSEMFFQHFYALESANNLLAPPHNNDDRKKNNQKLSFLYLPKKTP